MKATAARLVIGNKNNAATVNTVYYFANIVTLESNTLIKIINEI
jgi:hypothetical protein